MTQAIRINKYLATLGQYSRRESDRIVREERVTINGKVAALGAMVDPSTDRITLDDKTIGVRETPKLYWLLNKPAKILTSRKNDKGYINIYALPSLQNMPYLLTPVGRLDFFSEGLLLLTNDGELTYKLTHPKFSIEKQYLVIVKDKLESKEISSVNKKGFELEGRSSHFHITEGCTQNFGAYRGTSYFITLKSGQNRIIRKFFEKQNNQVLRLIRIGFHSIRLSEELRSGECRALTSSEIKILKEA